MFARRFPLVPLFVFVMLALLSCPTPIDRDLLRLVEDTINPTIFIDTPYPNSLYGATVQVEGNLSDSSFAVGDMQGLLKTLDFSVLGEPLLSRTVEFLEDGSFTVTPADPNPDFTFDPETGGFTLEFSTVGLDGGPKVLVFQLVDFNGNKAEKTLTLLEDPTGPHVDLVLPEYGTIYDLTVDISGFATNSTKDTNTNDVKILRWEIPAAGRSGEVDLELNPQGTAFSFDPDTGEFNHWFDTVGMSGDIYFIFKAYDYANHKTEISVRLLGDRPGPQITVVSPPPPPADPVTYSSAINRTFMVTGRVTNQDIDWSGFTYLASGSIRGVTDGTVNVPVHNFPWSFEDDFNFSFDPRAEGIAGVMTVRINATDSSGTRPSSVEFYVDDDPNPPTITSADLAADNSYVDIEFSEDSFTNSNGTGALVSGDFNMNYSANGGATLQSWGVTSISTLEVRVNLSYNSLPTGVETVRVTAKSNQVFDWIGNPMSSGESTATFTLTDQRPPTISDAVLAGNNSHVDVTFSEDVYANANGTGWLQDSDVSVSFSANGGTSLQSWSVSSSDHSELRVNLTYSGTPTGDETLEIKPSSGNAVFDGAGNAMDASESTGTITLN
jgi:hypothetical protein